MWHDAEKGKNGYVPTDVHWSEVPGRDDAWKKETIDNTSEQQFKVEFESLEHNTRINIQDQYGTITEHLIGNLYEHLKTLQDPASE
jgi:hypothetical protein